MSFNSDARIIRDPAMPLGTCYMKMKSCVGKLSWLAGEHYQDVWDHYERQFQFSNERDPEQRDRMHRALSMMEMDRSMILERVRAFERHRIYRKKQGHRQMSRDETIEWEALRSLGVEKRSAHKSSIVKSSTVNGSGKHDHYSVGTDTTREHHLHLSLVLLAAAVLLLLILLAPRADGGFTLAGTYLTADSPEMTSVFIASLFVAFPLIAAIIAVVAAYPFRGLPWKRKYLRAFLLSLFGVYALNILLFSLIAISS